MTQDVAGAAVVTGFINLLVSQLATRLLTFGLNLATARSLSPAAYGVAAVQFHLINTTILFLAREGFRRGCLRIDPAHPRATQRVLGTALLTLPIGAALSAAVTGGLIAVQAGGRGQDAVYCTAVVMQGGAAFVELCAEPLYILASVRLMYGLRAGVEAGATVAKAAVTFGLLQRGLVPAIVFSWGQLAYAAATLGGYLLAFGWMWARHRSRSQPQSRPPAALQLDRDALRTSAAFALQAGGKLVLAEGGKAVLVATTDSSGQGVYGLVTNLGSLVVRTIFQPFEEAAFAAFSRTAAQRDQRAVEQRASLLSLLCRAICLVGGLAAAFGPAYAHLALLLLYGQRWADSQAAPALGVYAGYVALLAANGILEAFVHAVADDAALHHANAALAAISVAHIALSVAGVRAAGAIGLLLADAANMALRIAYCARFVGAHFRSMPAFSIAQLLPRGPTMLSLGAALATTAVSRVVLLPESSSVAQWVGLRHPSSSALLLAAAVKESASLAARTAAHVAVGAACLAMVAGTAYVKEREVVGQLRRLRAGKEA